THLFAGGTDSRGNPLPAETYYPDGKLKTVLNALGQTTSYAYDLNARATTVTYPPDAGGNAGTARIVYDSFGMLVSSADPLNHTTNYVYNPDHTLKSVTDAMGRTTSYTYDANG